MDTENKSGIIYLLFLYFFMLLQSYESFLKKIAGGPFLVLLNFGCLFGLGFLMLKDNWLRKLSKVPTKYLMCLGYIMLLFNFYMITFGNYFRLIDVSWLFAFTMLVPFVAAPRWRAVGILCFALALVVTLIPIIDKIPINKAGSMLVLIETAIDDLLSGKNPYLKPIEVRNLGYTLSSIGYAPLMVLAYLPFRCAGLDIRYLSILAAVGFLGAYWVISRNVKNQDAWRANCLVFLSILSCPFSYLLISTKHVYFYGLLVFIMVLCLIKERNFLKVVFFAFAVATRQFAVVMGLPILWERNWRWLKNLGIVAAVLIPIFVPFMTENPVEFALSVLGKPNIGEYTTVRVDFGSSFSPGAGSGFNIGHLIKYLSPSWSVRSNVTAIMILALVISILWGKKKINIVGAVFFFYLAYLAFTVNYSQYNLWGIICVALAFGVCHQGPIASRA